MDEINKKIEELKKCGSGDQYVITKLSAEISALISKYNFELTIKNSETNHKQGVLIIILTAVIAITGVLNFISYLICK